MSRREELDGKKIRQLKSILNSRGVKFEDCVEKSDLIKRVIDTDPAPKPKPAQDNKPNKSGGSRPQVRQKAAAPPTTPDQPLHLEAEEHNGVPQKQQQQQQQQQQSSLSERRKKNKNRRRKGKKYKKEKKELNQEPAPDPKPVSSRARNKKKKGFTVQKTKKDLANEYLHLGIKRKNEGNRKEAMEYYQKGLECEPEDPVLYYNLGVCHAEENRMEAARDCYLNAVKYEPNFPFAQNNLGAYYKDHGDMERAIYHYECSLKADPNFATALNNISVTYYVMGRLHDAQLACEKAIRLDQNKAEAYNNMGTLYREEGRAKEAVACFAKCIELDPEQSAGRFGAHHNHLLAMNSLPAPEEDTEVKDTYNEIMWKAHKEWADGFTYRYNAFQYTKWNNKLTTQRPIRVGYLSSDLRTHPVSYFIEAPLRCMDRTKVDCFCYLNGPAGDARTHELQRSVPADRWKALSSRTPLEICELIREDKIDILVELGGHASGNRLDIMVRKPAPVQCTWIGYANTTGLSCIDYRITDPVADPVNTKQRYSEQLVRMPDPCAFLCYTGSKDSPPPKELPALKNGYITFGSFNTLAKVVDQVFDLWCLVLRTVKNSRLFLKCKPFASVPMKKKFVKRFEKHGISGDRITMITHVQSRKHHLDLYNEFDIALDTFPYAGTTTSCESIWMGVPVITLQRKKYPIHAQNVGASLFSRVPELRGFIAKDKETYVKLAVRWSKNLPKLAKIRMGLRESMKKSPLCDGRLFASKLAEVYTKMWGDYVNENK